MDDKRDYPRDIIQENKDMIIQISNLKTEIKEMVSNFDELLSSEKIIFENQMMQDYKSYLLLENTI